MRRENGPPNDGSRTIPDDQLATVRQGDIFWTAPRFEARAGRALLVKTVLRISSNPSETSSAVFMTAQDGLKNCYCARGGLGTHFQSTTGNPICSAVRARWAGCQFPAPLDAAKPPARLGLTRPGVCDRTKAPRLTIWRAAPLSKAAGAGGGAPPPRDRTAQAIAIVSLHGCDRAAPG